MTKVKRKVWTQRDMDRIAEVIGNSKPGSKEYGDAIRITANFNGVTYNAVLKKYNKYLKGQGFKKKVTTREFGDKKRSRFWSIDDLNTMMHIISVYEDKRLGFEDAAAHFGVTPNAIALRYRRFKAKKALGRTRLKNTKKVPVISNMPKGYKHKNKGAGRKRGRPVGTQNKIKDIVVDTVSKQHELEKPYKKRGPYSKNPKQEAVINKMHIKMKDVQFDLEKRVIVITY